MDRLGAHPLTGLPSLAAGRDPLPVIINRSGGTASNEGDALGAKLEQAFAAAGASVVLDLVAGDDIPAAIGRHENAPRVVVGGGDGTIGGAARRLAASGAELAVLPLGTRNHFARQIGIPLGLSDASQIAVSGRAIRVDLGEVDGHTFINNASLGAYVELVREREKSPLPKWLSSVLAGWRVLRKLRTRQFDLVIDGEPQSVHTSLLFIGNNRYELTNGALGDRAALDEGVLSVFALAPMSRRSLLGAAIRIALGKIDAARDFALQTTAYHVRILGDGEIGIALDGERLQMPLPIALTIRPRALKVVALPN